MPAGAVRARDGAGARAGAAGALAAVAVLGVACSAIAFVAFFALIGEAGPARGSLFVYLLPIVATALGVAFLGEHVGPAAALGLVLILAGSRLASRARLGKSDEGPKTRQDRRARGRPAVLLPHRSP